MKKIILLASIVYFLIAPFTYHPDTKLTLRYAALENNKIWDIYGYIANHKLEIPDFHYPPAHYWWLKIHYPLSKFIGGTGFDEWLASGSTEASFSQNALKYNLAAKWPLLILGLISGWLIFKIVTRVSKNETQGKLAALIWFFNPITIYSLVIMGQNDIVAIFLFLLGIFYYKKWWLMALFWGLAAGVKSYPLIWAIMFLLAYEKIWYKLILKITSVVSVYVLILSPWLTKAYFQEAVLNSGLSQRMFIANIPIGFDKTIILIPVLLVIIGLGLWKNSHKDRMITATKGVFVSSLIILGFSHFNPQWMIWGVPFLAIWWALRGITRADLMAIFIVFVAWMGLTLGFDDKFLTWGLVTPINPNLINFPSVVELIKNKGGDLSIIINLCQSALAGVAIWYILSNKSKHKYFGVKSININKWWVLTPWLVMVLIIGILLLIKTDIKKTAISDKKVGINELVGQEWQYQMDGNIKYLEIGLDNPGLNSEDKMSLKIRDERDNEVVKDFSGFNATADSWLRIDLPPVMSQAKQIQLMPDKVEIKDGLLKAKLDNQDRWAVNVYSRGRLPIYQILGKVIVIWWWWIIMAGISLYYLYDKK